MNIDLSVITVTRKRPQLLALCCQQVCDQSKGDLTVEHLIVSDGPDSEARLIAANFGAKYIEHEYSERSLTRDLAIRFAVGKYLWFLDDDNQVDRHALAALFAAANGFDIGVVRVMHNENGRFRLLPNEWTGSFVCGDIDTMCVCVRRPIAELERWSDCQTTDTEDYSWLKRLENRGVTIRFVPLCIGRHL